MPNATAEPALTFSTFVISLASSGLMHLGVDDGSRPPDLHLARQTLDLLAVLAEKTKGNLDDEEARLLAAVRDELTQKYEKAKRGGS